MYTKYPRTFHLPWSEGATDDDKTLSSVDHFSGVEVVVTEKMDGENTTIYPDGHVHARSIDSGNHPSRNWVKSLAGRIAHQIPEGWRICGENLYAKHSIEYRDLSSYFLVFSIWEGDKALSWEETVAYAEMLGLNMVPTLYKGVWDEKKIRALWTGTGEGYVVRKAESFIRAEFSTSIAKFVRRNHVQTEAHWMHQSMIVNGLRE